MLDVIILLCATASKAVHQTPAVFEETSLASENLLSITETELAEYGLFDGSVVRRQELKFRSDLKKSKGNVNKSVLQLQFIRRGWENWSREMVFRICRDGDANVWHKDEFSQSPYIIGNSTPNGTAVVWLHEHLDSHTIKSLFSKQCRVPITLAIALIQQAHLSIDDRPADR